MAPTLLNKVKLTVELGKEKNTNAVCITGKFKCGFYIHEVSFIVQHTSTATIWGASPAGKIWLALHSNLQHITIIVFLKNHRHSLESTHTCMTFREIEGLKGTIFKGPITHAYFHLCRLPISAIDDLAHCIPCGHLDTLISSNSRYPLRHLACRQQAIGIINDEHMFLIGPGLLNNIYCFLALCENVLIREISIACLSHFK